MAKKVRENQSSHNVEIKEVYKKLNSIYISKDILNDHLLEYGDINVLLSSDESFSIIGTLNKNGLLSGMSPVYSILNLNSKDNLEYSIINPNTINILNKPKSIDKQTELEPHIKYESVFKKKQLNHIHIPIFEPQNLKDWEPQTEVDVFMAFGVLQDYTDYRYCCSTSNQLLKELNYSATDIDNKSGKAAKPDAILLNRHNKEYLVAEFKVKSSSFTDNHGSEDIDVLVSWIDDAIEKKNLPKLIISLKEIARIAAKDQLD